MLKPVQLGKNSGLRVSQLCLGTMNFGKPGQGHQADWTLGLDESREIFKAAIERGLYYFDCADTYGIGACEEVVGQLLKELLPREEYVLGTKIAMPMGLNPNIWLPHLKFTLQTIAITYPAHPNDVSKRKLSFKFESEFFAG